MRVVESSTLMREKRFCKTLYTLHHSILLDINSLRAVGVECRVFFSCKFNVQLQEQAHHTVHGVLAHGEIKERKKFSSALAAANLQVII